jgi:hypothetical protein
MGVIPNLHVCGKCDILVPDFAEEGPEAWEVCAIKTQNFRKTACPPWQTGRKNIAKR